MQVNATLKLAIRKAGSPIFQLKWNMVSKISAVGLIVIAVSQFKQQSQERTQAQQS